MKGGFLFQKIVRHGSCIDVEGATPNCNPTVYRHLGLIDDSEFTSLTQAVMSNRNTVNLLPEFFLAERLASGHDISLFYYNTMEDE